MVLIQAIAQPRYVLKIPFGKGQKDRRTLLGESLKAHLQANLKKYQAEEYRFEGQAVGKCSGSSLPESMKHAARQAGVQKYVIPHILWHSVATHLIEDATDIRYMQKYSEYNSIKITERYPHAAHNNSQKIA